MAEIPLNLRQLGITYESLRRTQEYADSHPVAELGDWSTIGATSTTHGVVTDPQGVRIIILLPNYYPRMACRAHALTPIREGEGSIRLPTRPPSQALSAAAAAAAEKWSHGVVTDGEWQHGVVPPLAAPRSYSILLDLADDIHTRMISDPAGLSCSGCLEVEDTLYFELMRRFDTGLDRVHSYGASVFLLGMASRGSWAATSGGAFTTSRQTPLCCRIQWCMVKRWRVSNHHERTKAAEQHQPLLMFGCEFDRKMEELLKDGWKHVNWVYSAPEVTEGIRMGKDGEEYILYFLSSKDGRKDLRTIPSKRNPCANRCGKEGSQKCSTCRAAVYCSAECQQVHWKEHKLSCVRGNV
jgi:hypothetical protein